MAFIQRRNDKYIFLVLGVLVPIVIGSGYWAAAQEKDIDHLQSIVVAHSEQIEELQKQTQEVKEAIIKNTGKLDQIVDSVEKQEEQHEKTLDRIEKLQQKTNDLVIELLKKVKLIE